MKIINKKIIILEALLSPFLFFNHITSAESYESSVGVSFTLNPTINVTVSGGLTIPNLTPGDYKDSNSITVTANSNSIAGYTLSSTVGSSTNTSTELRKDGVDTTNKFSSITTNKASLSAFDDNTNTWGYSYSVDSGSTWISGDITGTPLTGYNGLPLYTSTNSIKLINSTTSGSSSVLFKIGARTTTNQIAGEYTNVINFIGVANPNPPTFDDLFAAAGKTKYNGYYTMQDMTSAICNSALQGSIAQLIDTRDGEIYMISKLKDDRCWMLDNLRLGSNEKSINLTSEDTNISSSYTLPQGVTTDFFNYYGSRINAVYKNDTVTNFGVGSGKIGVYYNFCAASAGTYCYSGSSGADIPDTLIDAPYDVCAKNWRLPTGGSSEESELQILKNAYNTATGTTGIVNLLHDLSVNLSGVFKSDSTQGYTNSNGFYYSSTRGSSYAMYNAAISSIDMSPDNRYSDGRVNGLTLRCIAR